MMPMKRFLVLAFALALALTPAALLTGGVAAQDANARTIELQVFECPPGTTGDNLDPEECEPLNDPIGVTITQMNGIVQPLTVEDATVSGNTYTWQTSASGQATDEWGLKQTSLPSGARAYVVLGPNVAVEQTADSDYVFTTSADAPSADVSLYVLMNGDAPVIDPPTTQTPGPQSTATATQPATTQTPTPESTTAPATTPTTAPATTPTTDTDEDAPVSAAATTFTTGDMAVVADGPLNLRSNTGLNAEVVEVLDTGDTLEILSNGVAAGGYTWYQVETSGGATGWVAGDFLAESDDTPSPAPPATGNLGIGVRAVVFDPPLNLRDAPSTSGTIVEVLAEGDLMEIIDGPTTADGYDWFQVTTIPGGVTGWVASDFITNAGFLVGDEVVVFDGPLNVREAADTTSSVLETVPTDSTGTITDGPVAAGGYDWYEMAVDGGVTGWVAGAFLALSDGGSTPVTPPATSGTFAVGSWVFVFDGPINFRDSASTSGGVLGQIPEGDGMLVQDGPVTADGYTWYQVLNDGETGWVAGEFITGGFFSGAAAVVADGPLNLRDAPSTDGTILEVILQDDVVTVDDVAPTITEDGTYWFQVQWDGLTGYVAGQYLGPA